MPIRFEVYPDQGRQFRWRMVDGNHRIVATSGEAYTREADAERAVKNIVEDLRLAELPQVTRLREDDPS